MLAANDMIPPSGHPQSKLVLPWRSYMGRNRQTVKGDAFIPWDRAAQECRKEHMFYILHRYGHPVRDANMQYNVGVGG